ncbi:MAG: LysR family transcriptional regulator [Rhodopseudomonas sp.]|nr:LysR family transcriptional regulator [Rhodopseudomonas sp.]
MKLNQLRNIVAIAERGSLRAAARDLGLAQPALSRSVQELEHELGVHLFERRARGMILTPMGLAFVRRASNVMTEVRRAREEIEQLDGGTGGTVVAAMSIVPHLAIAPQVLRPFRKRYQNVELQLIEGLYPTVESRLKDGSIDFYIGPPPERKLAPELVSELLFENDRRIFCRKGHPLAGAKSLRELADSDWMTTSVTYNAARELNELFSRQNLPLPRLALRSQSALTLMIFLANSDVLAMVPKQWAEFPFTVDAFETIDIGELPPAPPIVLIKRGGLPLTPAAEFLVDLARRHLPRPPKTATSKATISRTTASKPRKRPAYGRKPANGRTAKSH